MGSNRHNALMTRVIAGAACKIFSFQMFTASTLLHVSDFLCFLYGALLNSQDFSDCMPKPEGSSLIWSQSRGKAPSSFH